MQRACCISVDVDPISCYYEIHGLGTSPRELRSRVLCASLPRFARIFAEFGIAATFFIVAEDLDVRLLGDDALAMRAVLQEIRDAGHEIANHSYSHPYDLTRLSRVQIRDEIERAHGVLSEWSGEAIRGFRAPGYDISPEVLEELLRLGYQYDSSVFPAPGYYLAKMMVLGGLRLFGRKSGAVMTNARALFAPIDPYRPSAFEPWNRGNAELVELPVAVTRCTRTPVIGTNLLLAPPWLRSHWLDSMANRNFFNLEMHGIDLCGIDDQFPPLLVARQPDLRISVAAKMAKMRAIVSELVASGRDFPSLSQYVDRLSACDRISS